MLNRTDTPRFKAVVVLEMLREQRSVQDLSKAFAVDVNVLKSWKREFLENIEFLFTCIEKDRQYSIEEFKFEQKLLETLSRLKIENNDLKSLLSEDKR